MTSVMEWHPMFQKTLKLLGMRKLMVSMGRFGGPTDKKTLLYSSTLSVFEFSVLFLTFSGFTPPGHRKASGITPNKYNI